MIVIFGHHLSWLAALLLVGGVWRADRLLIADQWPGWYQLRTRILRKWPPGPARTTELLVCPWCSTLWLAAGTVTAWLFFPTVTLTVCLIFTVSAVAALVTSWTA